MPLGEDIKTALDALSAANKLDMEACWDAIGGVIETYLFASDFIGIIKMYDGSGLANIAARTEAVGFHTSDTVPEMAGWYVCNGNSGTPNLIGRFIRGEASSGNTDGADTHQLSIGELAQHSHGYNHVYQQTSAGIGGDYNDHTIPMNNTWSSYSTTGGSTGSVIAFRLRGTGFTSGNAGSNTAHNNMPAYYSVIYIIRVS